MRVTTFLQVSSRCTRFRTSFPFCFNAVPCTRSVDVPPGEASDSRRRIGRRLLHRPRPALPVRCTGSMHTGRSESVVRNHASGHRRLRDQSGLWVDLHLRLRIPRGEVFRGLHDPHGESELPGSRLLPCRGQDNSYPVPGVPVQPPPGEVESLDIRREGCTVGAYC